MFNETGIVVWGGLGQRSIMIHIPQSLSTLFLRQDLSLSKVTGRKSQGSVRGEIPRGKILTSESSTVQKTQT